MFICNIYNITDTIFILDNTKSQYIKMFIYFPKKILTIFTKIFIVSKENKILGKISFNMGTS